MSFVSHLGVFCHPRPGQEEASFHWLDGWTETIDDATGEPIGMTITIADWLYNGAIERGGVLTIHGAHAAGRAAPSAVGPGRRRQRP